MWKYRQKTSALHKAGEAKATQGGMGVEYFASPIFLRDGTHIGLMVCCCFHTWASAWAVTEGHFWFTLLSSHSTQETGYLVPEKVWRYLLVGAGSSHECNPFATLNCVALGRSGEIRGHLFASSVKHQ